MSDFIVDFIESSAAYSSIVFYFVLVLAYLVVAWVLKKRFDSTLSRPLVAWGAFTIHMIAMVCLGCLVYMAVGNANSIKLSQDFVSSVILTEITSMEEINLEKAGLLLQNIAKLEDIVSLWRFTAFVFAELLVPYAVLGNGLFKKLREAMAQKKRIRAIAGGE